MLGHLHQYLIRNGGDVCTGLRALDDVHGMTNRCADYLGLDLRIHFKNLHDILNEGHAVCGDVIQSSQEGRNVGGTGSGCQKRLGCGEDQCHIGVDALLGKHLHGLQSLGSHGNLNNHVGMDLRNLSALCDHALSGCGAGLYLAGDGTVNDVGDLLQGLHVVSALFGNEGRVGGHTGDDAHLPGFLDFLYIGCINKKLHTFLFSGARRPKAIINCD